MYKSLINNVDKSTILQKSLEKNISDVIINVYPITAIRRLLLRTLFGERKFFIKY